MMGPKAVEVQHDIGPCRPTHATAPAPAPHLTMLMSNSPATFVHK